MFYERRTLFLKRAVLVRSVARGQWDGNRTNSYAIWKFPKIGGFAVRSIKGLGSWKSCVLCVPLLEASALRGSQHGIRRGALCYVRLQRHLRESVSRMQWDCVSTGKKIQESGKGSDKVMEDLKVQLQLLWAFFCLPSTSVLNLLA